MLKEIESKRIYTYGGGIDVDWTFIVVDSLVFIDNTTVVVV